MKKHTSIISLPGLCLAALLGVVVGNPANASVLWDGDASHGTSVFNSLNIENQPGQVNVVNDPAYGQVFQFICYNPTTGIKTRTEGSHMRNFQPLAGNTYYFGWRHKWGPLPTACGKWQVVEQIHMEGNNTAAMGVPFGLHVDGCDPNMHFQYQNPSTGTPNDFLVLPFPLNSWHTFTFYEKWSNSESDGFVEVWYDGAHQILANGSYRYPAAWCASGNTSYWKWGVYRSGSGGMIGTAYAYLGQAKAGTTYADVNLASGGGGGTIDTSATYMLQNAASGLVLNQQGSLTNGSPVTQWGVASSDNLRWKFIATDSGYYQINSVKSGKDAVVQGASTAAGAGVIQWSFGSAQNDQWKPVQNSDGSYTLYNRHSGLVMDDPGSSTSTSTQMIQYTANGASNQKWVLLKQ